MWQQLTKLLTKNFKAMKKIVLLILFMFSLSFAFANNGEGDDNVISQSADGVTIVEIKTDAQTPSTSDNDALYCSIQCGEGYVYSCWFCSCDSLPDCSGGQQQQ